MAGQYKVTKLVLGRACSIWPQWTLVGEHVAYIADITTGMMYQAWLRTHVDIREHTIRVAHQQNPGV